MSAEAIYHHNDTNNTLFNYVFIPQFIITIILTYRQLLSHDDES